MMKSFRLIIAMVFLLAGCASLPQGFSMYPKPLQLEETVPPGMAVILVGISGSASINYLQFTHSSMPAINVKFDAVADDIVAIVIPVGIKQMELNTITVGGHRSGYFSTVMS
jgi:hypothetical protein